MGGFQWGMYVIEEESQQGRCLHQKKQKIKNKKKEDSRNRRHSLHEQIVPIPPQQIPDVEAEEDNATLKEAGYMEDDIIDPLVNEQSCEELNNYVTPDANVTQQQPWPVVKSPNRSCHPVVDVNVTPPFQTTTNFASKQKRTLKRIQVDESELTSMEGKVAKCTILRRYSQIMKQYFYNKLEACNANCF